MQQSEWTPERLQEIMRWKKENDATWQETADHFKVKHSTLYSAYNYHQQKKKGKKTKALAVKPAKQAKFIDIQAQHTAPEPPGSDGNREVEVVFCKVRVTENQLANALKGVFK